MSRPDGGFALVEAVVALGIVAAILGVTFQTIAGARRTITAAEQRRLAMLEAESLTASLGATIPLVAGSSSGERDGLRWRVDLEPAASREIQKPLMHSIVTVRDERDQELVRLETLRLAK